MVRKYTRPEISKDTLIIGIGFQLHYIFDLPSKNFYYVSYTVIGNFCPKPFGLFYLCTQQNMRVSQWYQRYMYISALLSAILRNLKSDIFYPVLLHYVQRATLLFQLGECTTFLSRDKTHTKYNNPASYSYLWHNARKRKNRQSILLFYFLKAA